MEKTKLIIEIINRVGLTRRDHDRAIAYHYAVKNGLLGAKNPELIPKLPDQNSFILLLLERFRYGEESILEEEVEDLVLRLLKVDAFVVTSSKNEFYRCNENKRINNAEIINLKEIVKLFDESFSQDDLRVFKYLPGFSHLEKNPQWLEEKSQEKNWWQLWK